MTGALYFNISSPIVDEKDEMVGVFGVDIKFEDWVKRVEDIAEATQIALREEQIRLLLNFQFGIEVRNAACNQRYLEGKAVVQITAIEITIDHLI